MLAAELFMAAYLAFHSYVSSWAGYYVEHEELMTNVDHNAIHGNRAALELLVIGYFGDAAPEAFRILQCENVHWDPRAVSATDDYGLFQINWVHTQPGGRAHGVDLMNPRENVRIAYGLYQEQGWWPWTCYRG